MVSCIQRLFYAVACLLCLVAGHSTRAVPMQQREIIVLAQLPDAIAGATKSNTHVATVSDYRAAKKANLPPWWLAIPFVVLLCMIATGPLLYTKFWHQHYAKCALSLAFLVLLYYFWVLRNWEKPMVALMEYVQFIALIAALYVASGGILIAINKQATPFTNLCTLLVGAVIANLVGTTGASMLLIRPYIRLNQGNVKAYHIVFFIFIVSNVGGGLTPIGDPPLFLGFLSGVPFFWALQHSLLPWLVALLLLGVIFYYLDSRNVRDIAQVSIDATRPFLYVVGGRNLVWLAMILGAVFIDPNIFDWVPALRYGHHSFSFLRELVFMSIACVAYRYANEYALQENSFSWAPLREVAMLFVGIFGTMIPALQLIGDFAASETGHAIITHNTLYWGAGICSSILDNAPTYLNFGAASMAAHGADITVIEDVKAFASGSVFYNSVLELKAISIASVFFGAMTYIGNGPNFMVKAIAEQQGLHMPSFFAYVRRFSVPILLPVLVVIWLLFFAFA